MYRLLYRVRYLTGWLAIIITKLHRHVLGGGVIGEECCRFIFYCFISQYMIFSAGRYVLNRSVAP